MKQHHIAAVIGIVVLAIASVTKDQQLVGWWMVGGLLFLALSFVIFVTRR